MNLQYRIDLLVRLKEYMMSEDQTWLDLKERASLANGWFLPQFINLSVKNIIDHYLDKEKLNDWIRSYPFHEPEVAKKVGIVMAGNIPLVGFHDFLCVFITGHIAVIKPSSKDEILIKHLTDKLVEWDPTLSERIMFTPMLKGCDAYIATGSNNTSRYFDYYFGKYPNIIRRNRTSVAILDGSETSEDLKKLADDVYQYFGFGCRNVTKLMVPEGYDFIELIQCFKKYSYLADHHKYKNNYDYNLAIHILNKHYYMTDGSILLIENAALFSPISQLNYEYYKSQDDLKEKLKPTESLQCIVGKNFVPFGKAQEPGLKDYADGIDTVNFLLRL